MERDWIQGGFFLVTDAASPRDGTGVLPKRLLTVSTCIAESYPDTWAMPSPRSEPDEPMRVRERLGLTEPEFRRLQSWVQTAMGAEEFGWPNVFLNLRAAREFNRRFLTAIRDIRLVGLSLESEACEVFIHEEAPKSGHGAPGVWTCLSKRLPVANDGIQLGFEVLGYEYGGSFHTFSCNGLEREYRDKLGVALTSCGLIGTYEDAVAACEFTNRGDVGAEPVPWDAWRVDEYRLDAG